MAEYLVLNVANRQGTFTSSSVVIPSGLTKIKCEVIVDLQSEYEDPGNTIRFAVYYSTDSGATWAHRAGFTWVGGRQELPGGIINPHPGFTLSLNPEDAGTRWRAEIDVPIRMRLGARITV